MNELIESIVNKQYTKADELIHEALKNIVDRKLHEVKKMCAAKMSVEQLKVDSHGKFMEPTGNIKLASIERAERGLAEGDVVPLGDNKRLEKSKSGIMTHEGSEHKVFFDPKESKLTILRNGKPQGTIEGSAAHEAHNHFMRSYNNYRNDDTSHEKSVDAAALNLKDYKHKFKPSLEATSGKIISMNSMKEEAKKAALSIVSKRPESREEKTKRFLNALEGPGKYKDKPNIKVVKEQDIQQQMPSRPSNLRKGEPEAPAPSSPAGGARAAAQTNTGGRAEPSIETTRHPKFGTSRKPAF